MTSSTQQHPQQQEPFLHIPYFKDCGNFTTFWVSWKWIDILSISIARLHPPPTSQARNIIVLDILLLVHHHHLRSMQQHYLSHPSRLRCVHEMSMPRLRLRHYQHCTNLLCTGLSGGNIMTRTRSTITNMMIRTTPRWFRLCVTPFDNVPLRIVLEVQQQREAGVVVGNFSRCGWTLAKIHWLSRRDQHCQWCHIPS